jgi:hypothetical protein
MPALRTTFLTMVTVLADEAEEEDEEEFEESEDDADDASVAAALLAAAAAAAADWRCDADGARPAARYQTAPMAAAPTAATAATAHALSARLKEDDAGLFALLDDDDGAEELLPLGAAPALGFDMSTRIRNRIDGGISGGERKHPTL